MKCNIRYCITVFIAPYVTLSVITGHWIGAESLPAWLDVWGFLILSRAVERHKQRSWPLSIVIEHSELGCTSCLCRGVVSWSN